MDLCPTASSAAAASAAAAVLSVVIAVAQMCPVRLGASSCNGSVSLKPCGSVHVYFAISNIVHRCRYPNVSCVASFMPDVFVMYEKSRGMSGEAVFAFSISNTVHVCRHPHGLHDVGPHGLHDVGLCIVAQKCPAIR